MGSKEFREISRQIKMRMMIDNFRTVGHHFAKIDPLSLNQNQNIFGRVP